MAGFMGKILTIDLSEGVFSAECPEEIHYRTFIGGRGFSAYYMLRDFPPGGNSLGPENLLVFATGVLTGVPVIAMPRFVVGAKSPLTGGLGQSEAGGYWGPELKRAGYDAVVVKGQAPKPVYIFISDEDVQIREACKLWGRETGEVQDLIRQELGDRKVQVAQIGPAGEKCVRYACITNNLKHYNGRNGLGAVMGSKNLRAIAVRGRNKIPIADIEKISEIGGRYRKVIMQHFLSRGLYEYGTSGVVNTLNASGILPTKNFVNGEFYGAQSICGEAMADTILKRREGCYGCSIRCKRIVEVDANGLHVNSKYGGPEYESIGAFGSLCCIDRLEIIAKANELCNRYGMDTISTGASIAFAMECFEKGIITHKDTGGLEVTFGNSEALLRLITMIKNRDGIGDLLAEGTYEAAKRIGRGAEDCVQCVKGQEMPMHDPRGKTGVGIGLAVSTNATDHMVAPHDTLLTQEGSVLNAVKPLGINEPLNPLDLSWKKVRNFVYLEQFWSFLNMAGVCLYGPAPRGPMAISDVVALLDAATGWETSLWEMMKAGERAINMARVFNLREGLKAKDDSLPRRLFNKLENGRLKGTALDEEKVCQAVTLYYGMRGWDDNGVPLKAKLLELDLDWL